MGTKPINKAVAGFTSSRGRNINNKSPFVNEQGKVIEYSINQTFCYNLPFSKRNYIKIEEENENNIRMPLHFSDAF